MRTFYGRIQHLTLLMRQSELHTYISEITVLGKKRCWTAKPARATYYYFILSDGPCLSAPLVRLLSRFPTSTTVPIRFIFSPILNHRNPHHVLKRFGSLLADTRIITFPLRWTTYVSQGAKSIKSKLFASLCGCAFKSHKENKARLKDRKKENSLIHAKPGQFYPTTPSLLFSRPLASPPPPKIIFWTYLSSSFIVVLYDKLW